MKSLHRLIILLAIMYSTIGLKLHKNLKSHSQTGTESLTCNILLITENLNYSLSNGTKTQRAPFT
jgi:hypothetical protein